MEIDLEKIPCFGVAGNFTGHLEQAGEAVDFLNVKAASGAPKALFPTYLPVTKGTGITVTPDFLHIFPFDSSKIIFPENEEKLQIEPECAVICEVQWGQGQNEKSNHQVLSLNPILFGASNDCSIRKEGARKISLKKNWGNSSKGLAAKLLPIDVFDFNGVINNYRIASFLVRKNEVYSYGEDSAIRDYNYIYGQLLEWVIDKLNNQKDEGPAEKISDYLNESGYPNQIMISIGATRYTDYGEHNFLQKGDYSVVILYPEGKYTELQIRNMAKTPLTEPDDVSVLRQLVE